MTEEQERQEILRLYADLRVADVRDGMDTLKLRTVGSMDRSIKPLWRTRAFGIALTVRYLPYNDTVPECDPDEYMKWAGWYYNNVCIYPWVDAIQDGDFAVIDLSGVEAGLMGSDNTLTGIRKGIRGFVSSDGVRDTDEVILQKVPFWSRYSAKTMVQGRIMYDAMNVPVAVGGVAVFPGDVVVADGDGVIVVPRKYALKVGKYAYEEHERDKINRRKHYEALGLNPDGTI